MLYERIYFKVPMKRIFYCLIRNDEEWRYFIVIALLVAELFKILIYEDLWRHSVDTKWCKITTN